MSRKLCKLYISRLMALLLCCVMLLPCIPSARAEGEGGTCGSNLTWNLSAGTLTISGSGDMYHYAEGSPAPWSDLVGEITRLDLPAGLTNIGNHAFENCWNLLAVSIPDSVRSIGSFGFAFCRNLEYLYLGSGLRTIDAYAFYECESLQALNLPGGLAGIGTKAFYGCSSIPSVVVPSSVTNLGNAAFAGCGNLISADIQANIQFLPEFLFYECSRLNTVTLPSSTTRISSYAFRGCDNLATVRYQGNNMTLNEIRQTVANNVNGFESQGNMSSYPDSGFASSTTTDTAEDGTVTQQHTSVSQGNGTTISSNVETENGNCMADISVTLDGSADSWEDVSTFIESELSSHGYEAGSGDSANVNVYMQDSGEISSNFVQSMSQLGVSVTVTTRNGSTWKLDTGKINTENASGKYNMSYTLKAASAEVIAELGGYRSFQLIFASSADVDSEVKIQLGSSYANQNATLFVRNDSGLVKVQRVLVDETGCAHFYLKSVDSGKEYYIAMNMPVERVEDAPIVPQEMMHSYPKLENYNPIQYEITGRTSSWNMGLGKVMTILAVVMVSVIVLVGFVMYLWNKQRLKNGYQPDWDDEE